VESVFAAVGAPLPAAGSATPAPSALAAPALTPLLADLIDAPTVAALAADEAAAVATVFAALERLRTQPVANASATVTASEAFPAAARLHAIRSARVSAVAALRAADAATVAAGERARLALEASIANLTAIVTAVSAARPIEATVAAEAKPYVPGSGEQPAAVQLPDSVYRVMDEQRRAAETAAEAEYGRLQADRSSKLAERRRLAAAHATFFTTQVTPYLNTIVALAAPLDGSDAQLLEQAVRSSESARADFVTAVTDLATAMERARDARVAYVQERTAVAEGRVSATATATASATASATATRTRGGAASPAPSAARSGGASPSPTGTRAGVSALPRFWDLMLGRDMPQAEVGVEEGEGVGGRDRSGLVYRKGGGEGAAVEGEGLLARQR
jgi:hypothetical protein